ncbi:hypothetical protein BDZ89DRAFT_632651 [Hymenopellis radicata]|nr:hypothetical protein BDZ89DRAFT_632651 [Hymenopellis radicata]
MPHLNSYPTCSRETSKKEPGVRWGPRTTSAVQIRLLAFCKPRSTRTCFSAIVSLPPQPRSPRRPARRVPASQRSQRLRGASLSTSIALCNRPCPLNSASHFNAIEVDMILQAATATPVLSPTMASVSHVQKIRTDIERISTRPIVSSLAMNVIHYDDDRTSLKAQLAHYVLRHPSHSARSIPAHSESQILVLVSKFHLPGYKALH